MKKELSLESLLQVLVDAMNKYKEPTTGGTAQYAIVKIDKDNKVTGELDPKTYGSATAARQAAPTSGDDTQPVGPAYVVYECMSQKGWVDPQGNPTELLSLNVHKSGVLIKRTRKDTVEQRFYKSGANGYRAYIVIV